jgi:release factor glutamine methyltransferase
VVEAALGELRRIAGEASSGDGGEAGQPDPSDRRVVSVDLGTGSGAIALSLATEGGAACAGLEVWATDQSGDALEVARENLGALRGPAAARVRLAEGTWFSALPSELAGHVDLVVSNPPYVAEAEYPRLDPSVREWEPRTALVAGRGLAGEAGMAAIESIVADAPQWLSGSGAIVIEIAPTQARASLDAAHRAGFSLVSVERDLAGRHRMLVGRC